MDNEKSKTQLTRKNPVILIVDNNPFNIQVLNSILMQSGYVVNTALNGINALQSIEQNQPDLVLLDSSLPVNEGYEIYHRLRRSEFTRFTPVIFISDKAGMRNLFNGFKPEIVDYFYKPVDNKELIGRIKYHLSTSKILENYEEELKMNKKFFSIISHDLKGSFGIIQNFIGILKDDSEMLSPVLKKEILNDIESTSQNALGLLGKLLEWAQSHTGRIKFHLEEIDLEQLVDETINYYGVMAKRKNIRLVSNTDPLAVFADKNMVQLVLRNLLSNALKFTPSGGTVEIRSVCVDDSVKIEIADSGIGIAHEKINHLFHVERKVTTPGTENEPGNGMGLIMCREFLHYHETDLEIESTPYEGTTVCFMLPLALKEHTELQI